MAYITLDTLYAVVMTSNNVCLSVCLSVCPSVCVKGALTSLVWLRGTDDVEAEFTEIEEAVVAMHQNESQGVSLFDLIMNPRIFKPFLLSLALMFFQQASGVNAVIFYASQIFTSAGFSSDPDTPTMIVGAVLVAMTLLSCIVADVAGRRILLLTSAVAVTLSSATLGLYFYITEIHQVVCLSVCLSVTCCLVNDPCI